MTKRKSSANRNRFINNKDDGIRRILNNYYKYAQKLKKHEINEVNGRY